MLLVPSLDPLEPVQWFGSLIPQVLPALLLMVHTSNFLWKQQKLPPSPLPYSLTQRKSRTADSQQLTNAGERVQKPSSLASRAGQTLWCNSDPRFPAGSREARHLLKSHLCSSQFLLLPNPAALTSLQVTSERTPLMDPLHKNPHLRLCFWGNQTNTSQ